MLPRPTRFGSLSAFGLALCIGGATYAQDAVAVVVDPDIDEIGVETASVLAAGPKLDPVASVEAATEAGGLEKLPTKFALGMIDLYLGVLNSRMDAFDITEDLYLIRNQLADGRVNRFEVGKALKRLGTNTATLAEDEGSKPYEAFGKALKSAGTRLAAP